MRSTAAGEDPHTTLTQYVGPTEIVHKHGRTLIYDAGAGEVIAELTEEAANALRHHTPAKMTYDGDTTLALED